MKKTVLMAALGVALAGAAHAQVGVVLTPKTSFMGDGWFAPGEGGYTFLGTANNERGIAYNPTNDRLYLLSRNGGVNVRKLDGQTGADLGNLDATGISGGTFAASMMGCDDAGNIYAANLAVGATAIFKVYKWTSEVGVSTAIYNAATGIARTGDSFDVDGPTGNIIASGTGSVGFASINGGVLSVKNPPSTATGDFRLGLTYLTSTTMYSGQAGGGPFRYVDITANSLLGNSPTTSAAERPMDYAVVDGHGLLATLDTNNSKVRVYDMTNPFAPKLRAEATTTFGTLTSNSNGTGQVKFGKIAGNQATLYAMSSNQGIQAFNLAVPEPGSVTALLVGAALLLRRRRS